MIIKPTNVLSPLLRSDFELGIKKLSEIMECSQSTVRRVIKSTQPVPEKSIKNLSLHFRTTEDFWINLNNNYKISITKSPEKVMKFSGDIKDRFNIINKLMEGKLTAQEIIKKSLGKTTITEASLFIGLPRKTLSDFISGNSEMSTHMAFKLSYAFETNIDYWLKFKKNKNKKTNKLMELK